MKALLLATAILMHPLYTVKDGDPKTCRELFPDTKGRKCCDRAYKNDVGHTFVTEEEKRVLEICAGKRASLPPANVTNYLTSAGKSLAATALAAYTGSAETSALALKGGINVTVPTSGSALTALGAWLSAVVPGTLASDGSWAASCDGPVAAGVHAFTGAKLRQGGNVATDNCVGIGSGPGCGNNSLYDVGWSVNVQG